MTESLELPERARLFHIGIPKSGSTALQHAATAERANLKRHGVLYPGHDTNHRLAVLSFMGRRWGWDDDAVPDRSNWDRMMGEIEADRKRRVFISHEFASESDDATAARFVDALGDRTHVVITVRSPGSILPSAWQQYVKAGTKVRFDAWLKAVLADPPNRKVTASFHDRNDQAGVTRRWAEAAGAENVTVVVLDRERPRLLYDAFEQMLGLPHETLAAQDMGGWESNRGLSAQETELFRRMNEVVRSEMTWPQYMHLIRHGALGRVMENRAADAERLLLPQWAAERAAELGAQYAEAIEATGVRVVGDLSTLSAKAKSRADDEPAPTEIPIDLAVEALAGTLSAATHRGAFFGERDTKSQQRSNEERLDRAKSKAARMSVGQVVRLGLWFVRTKAQDAFRRLRAK